MYLMLLIKMVKTEREALYYANFLNMFSEYISPPW